MRAIILAAGMGTRLRPLTDDRPKALVEVGGESFFERQLRLLAAAGVVETTVVTGYEARAFDPWRGRPGLEFLHNERFHDRNNLWSMLLAGERLADSLVLEGDVWIGESLLPRERPSASCWFVGWRTGMRNEWAVRTGPGDRVEEIVVSSGDDWILSGVSYWSGSDGAFVARRVAEAAALPGNEQLFWDEIPRRSLAEISVHARRIGPEDWAEIDTLEDHAALEARLAAARRP